MASRPRIWLTPLHRAEWAHAIERHVFERRLSRHKAEQVHQDFERDRAEGVWPKPVFRSWHSRSVAGWPGVMQPAWEAGLWMRCTLRVRWS